MRHHWPPRNQLCIRAAQNATGKVNLQGAITAHTTGKWPLYCECHSPDHLQATNSRSPLCFLQLNYPKASDSLTFLTLRFSFPPGSSLSLILLGLGQHERGLTKTWAWCWVFAKMYSRHGAVSLAGHPTSKWYTWEWTSHQSFLVHQIVFERQQLNPWRPEASEAGEKISYWEGPLLCHWRDENFDPWHYEIKQSVDSLPMSLPIQGSVPDLLCLSCFFFQLVLQQTSWSCSKQLCVGENTFIQIQPNSISPHAHAGYLLLLISGLLCSAPCMCDLLGKTFIKEK